MVVKVGVRGPGHVSRVALSVSTGDTTPDAFSFTDATAARLSTSYESNAITVAGIDAAADLTITGGEYQINGGAWASAATTASNGDSIKVRGTSSASLNTAVNVALTIGGVSDTFTITTVVNQEASDFLGRAVTAGATEPNATRRGLYDAAYTSLKSGPVSGSNILAKLDIIYLLAAHEESTGLLNLKGATYNATKTGTLTFTQDKGFLGDGATGYLDTGLADNAGGVNWSQDSAFLAAYVNAESAGTTIPIVGTSGTSNQALLVPLQSGTGRARIHVGANAVVTPSVANRLGWTIGNRSSSTDLIAMRDTVTGASQTTASTSPVAANINLFRNATATPSFAADQLAAFGMGGSLTADERTDFINTINTFLTDVGAT